MYKFILISALVAVALAEPGYLAAPEFQVPVATSYSNSYRAPVIKAAPLAYASAPIYAAQPAALTYSASPAYYNAAPATALHYGASPALYNSAPYPYLSGAYIH